MMQYLKVCPKWLFMLVSIWPLYSSVVAQSQIRHTDHSTSDTCYHIEFSLAHHYIELAHLMEENQIEPNSLLAGNLNARQIFAEFYRLVTLIQAKYPDHHLEEAFYDKAIEVANKQQNLGASAYLIARKEKMLLELYGADYLTKHCHCGKCTRHED